jgi:hypothetical protein
MKAIRSRARAFLGLPALDDPAATRQPRVVPWRAAPAAFALALALLVALGFALERALGGRDNWQVNAPAIAGLTAILLLAPSSSTQAKARNALVAAVVGLTIVGAGFGVAVARHKPDTAYGTTAFLIVTIGALVGCVEFTVLTHVDRWTLAARQGSTVGAVRTTNGAATGDATDADAAAAADAPSADT